MNRNILRAPLIKSATLLAVVSLLVYLTATSSEGSLWNSLGMLFFATLRIVQLGLGLIVSLLFCMTVLVGIFLGCVAMVSRESAAKMVEHLRQKVSDNLLLVRSLVVRDVPSRGARVLEDHGSGLKQETLETIEGSLAGVRENQFNAAEKIENVMQRLDRVEQGEDIKIILERHVEHVQGLVARVEQIQDQMGALQERVNELIQRSRDEQVDPPLADLGDRMNLLEMAIVPLKEEMIRIRAGSVAEEMPESPEGLAAKKPAGHRLFTHLKNKAMQTKIEDLVTETLDKDMSYAQVIDHLVAHAKGKSADIIAAHPSLAKDYIRYRRNNG